MGAFIGALLGLLRGFTGPEVQRRRVPNQGIRQSARNIGVCFLIGASLIGVPYGVASLGTLWLATGVSPDIADMVAVVGRCAALMGLLGGLVPGAACLQHFTLRFILWCQGAMPWQCVHFLGPCHGAHVVAEDRWAIPIHSCAAEESSCGESVTA